MLRPYKVSSVSIGLLVSLAALVLGARWAVVNRFGSDLPVWDQWDAEGIHSLVPWFTHRHFLQELFLPHNEHRVVLTKLLNLGLTLANGQWDQRLECAVNAALPALVAAGLFVLGCRGLGPRWQVSLFLLLAAVFGLPLSWQNVLGGFHSQQFFLIGLSFGAITWLPFASSGSLRWWLGASCATLALFSMASGLLAAAIVAALVAERMRRGKIPLRAAFPTLAFCATLISAGWLMRAPVYYHEALKAHTPSDFAITIIRSLQWPGTATPWFSVLFWLPSCWLTWRVWQRDKRANSPGSAAGNFGIILAGLAGWVILQLLATAYARGAGGPAPSSRYIDTLAFGQAVNGMSLACLWSQREPEKRGSHILTALGIAWIAAFSIGVAEQTLQSLATDMPLIRRQDALSEQNVRGYLLTGDEAYLRHREIPYPSEAAFLERIKIPALRGILPASVRPPMELRAAAGAALFTRNGPKGREGEGTGSADARPYSLPNGLSPETRPQDAKVTWGSFSASNPAGAGEWKSAPLRPNGEGWLSFGVAGSLGRPGVALELRDAQTGTLLGDVRPRKVPGNAWRTVYVREPRSPFVVVARIEDPRQWFAFGEPVEMGPLSYWALQTVKSGTLVVIIAASSAALLGLAGWFGDQALFSLAEVRRAISSKRVKPKH